MRRGRAQTRGVRCAAQIPRGAGRSAASAALCPRITSCAIWLARKLPDDSLMHFSRIAPLSLVLFLCNVAPALADMPPPPGYEEKCTVALKEQPGTTCKECRNGPGSGDLEQCKKQFAGTKFTYVCQTYGASFWTEVWCDGPPREDTGCSCSQLGVAPRTAFAGALAGLAALVLALRRRRATRN